ncbi:hypothetical protein A3A21_01240 [Candidatus Jorgensenbacteria bacterium RIFCSPLOWO2_01_FULL_45_25b]|uniref:Uncharacterized protein n=1 Tax=Candidatus Jorgensenbacteria bacterium RIFCSPLOWO2_01_FULL_45_25b TaxID=1798471 RepID=A0A1F6BVJ1_9BACT|nr:MAG: hypothetical protein A3A21_01240 [Candidatus Jorgensenbacteria bacterium RIFCSPLOWO2_01_FULL_45_25b]
MWNTKWTLSHQTTLERGQIFFVTREGVDKAICFPEETMRSKLLVAAVCRYVHPSVEISAIMEKQHASFIRGTANLGRFLTE